MNVLEFVLLASTGVVIVTVGIDAGRQVWSEKRSERKTHCVKVREAETILYCAISKRLNEQTDTIKLRAVEPQNKSTGGRHRLTTA